MQIAELRRHSSIWVFFTALLCSMSSVAASSDKGTHPAAPGKNKAEPTVAVLYFDYSGNDPDMAVLKKGLANMLITDLVEVEGVKVVERARLQELLGELKLNQSKTIDRKKAVEIGKMAGALYIVVGHYLTFKDTLLIEARLLNTSTSVYVGKFKGRVKGKADEFFELQQALSQQLQTQLAKVLPSLARFAAKNKARKKARQRELRALAQKAGAMARVSSIGSKSSSSAAPYVSKSTRVLHAPRAEAESSGAGTSGRLPYKLALLYAKALDAKDQGNTEQAKKLLKTLLKKAPGFRLAHSDLARLNAK